VTSVAGGAVPVTWLASGRIAFTDSRHRLFTTRADGSDIRGIALSDASDPSFSPRGRSIVFVRRSHLWVSHSDGSHAHRVTGGRVSDASPSFSPDGEWIAFRRPTDTRGESGGDELWIVDIHGHRERRVVREPAAPGGGYTAQAEGTPAWQPLR
jgi:Tol biopolymer transport system component